MQPKYQGLTVDGAVTQKGSSRGPISLGSLSVWDYHPIRQTYVSDIVPSYVYTVCLFRTSLRWFFSRLSGFTHHLSFFLSLLVRSYMSITPGSANLEILITKKQKQHKKHKNFWLKFCLNKECP